MGGLEVDMAQFKLSKQDKEEFNELYEYVRSKILEYDKNQALSPNMVMKLHGLRDGNFYHSISHTPKANYSYYIILKTFQFCSLKIRNMLLNVSFNDENHKFNAILKIVRENLNDVYLRMKKADRVENKSEQWNVNTISEKHYIPKTKDNSNKDTEQYW